MDQETQAVFDAAKQLSPASQAELVEAVLEAMPPVESDQQPHSDQQTAAAWGDEISRRRDEVRAGDVELVDRDTVRIRRRSDD